MKNKQQLLQEIMTKKCLLGKPDKKGNRPKYSISDFFGNFEIEELIEGAFKEIEEEEREKVRQEARREVAEEIIKEVEKEVRESYWFYWEVFKEFTKKMRIKYLSKEGGE